MLGQLALNNYLIVPTTKTTAPSTALLLQLNGLVALSVITNTEAEAMNDMANVTMTWGDYYGYGELGIGLVQSARRING